MSGSIVHLDPTGEVAFRVHPDPMVMRGLITELKDRLLAATSEHREMPVEHLFLDGMYLRKLHIQKGTILVGKIHTKPCMNIVAKGDISVMTETGAMRVQAGFTLVSPAGLQKVGYAHEDTIFVNVFRTDVTDPEAVESDIASESFDFLKPSADGMEVLCQ